MPHGRAFKALAQRVPLPGEAVHKAVPFPHQFRPDPESGSDEESHDNDDDQREHETDVGPGARRQPIRRAA